MLLVSRFRPGGGDWRLTRCLDGVGEDRAVITAWGVGLARRAGLALIGRAGGRRFIAPEGEGRIVFDGGPAAIAEEPRQARRKGATQ